MPRSIRTILSALSTLSPSSSAVGAPAGASRRTSRAGSPPSVAPSSVAPLSPALPRRAALAALLLPLAACAGGSEDSGESDGSGGAAGSGTSDGGGDGAPADGDQHAGSDDGPVSIADPWVKSAEEGMTSAFGTLTNTTDRDLVLVAAATPVSDEVELHETASDGSGGMSMQEKEGGFPLPAGGELVLEPGGNHIMLMGLAEPLLPGDEVELTLRFEDGTEQPFTATVKDFAGAQEDYDPEGSSGSGASDGGGERGAGHGGGEHDGHGAADNNEHDGHDGHDGHDDQDHDQHGGDE